jgi:uroporphyrinogen decarboxylase
METIKLTRRGLPNGVPLIGFSGAPFTLASYAIEGSGSKNYVRTKSMMYNHPAAWQALMQKLTRSLVRYINAQIVSGCQAVQLFDSWVGCMSPGDYRAFVLPFTKAIIDGVANAPVINFFTGNPALLPLVREAGGDVIGLDWRVDLGEASRTIGYDVAVQGNLDPVSLFSDLPTFKMRAQSVMDSAAGRPGHIFNLGHGVMPEMNPENVKALVKMVHEMGMRK